MQRIRRGSAVPVLRVSLFDQDGNAAPTLAGTLTCTITRADGTVMATARSTTTVGGGVYTCALTTTEAQTLDVLSAQWLDGANPIQTSGHRIVGSFLFTLPEVRVLVPDATDAQLIAVRDQITDLIETATRTSWCPSYDITSTRGYGRGCVVSPWRPVRSVRSVAFDGVAQVVANLDLDIDAAAGLIYMSSSTSDHLTIGVEHGFDNAPSDLRDAALIAAKDRLLRRRSALSDRSRSVSDDMGTRLFSYAGKGHPTGLDEVDAVIMGYARPVIGIG